MGVVTHGMRVSARVVTEYTAWISIKARTKNPNNKNYLRYGGRGITICERWDKSFEAFYEDMGVKPAPEYSIERINNNGNYEPGNCRWATRKEQANNRRPKPNKTGYAGVFYDSKKKLYGAYIKNEFIGTTIARFKNPEDAAACFISVRRQILAENQ